MTIFITRARLTKDGLRELTAAPEDRLQALSRLISQVGGKLVTYFLTSGDYDLLLIFEGPSFEALAPALIAAAAASGLTDLNTVVALTASDMKSALTKAGALTARNDTAVAAADVPSAGSEAEPTDEASEEAKWAAAILDAQSRSVDDLRAGRPARYYVASPTDPVRSPASPSPLSTNRERDSKK
jgi:uncharacterized protein with GYD domain